MEIKPCPFCGGEAQVRPVWFPMGTKAVTRYCVNHTCNDGQASISLPSVNRLFASKEEAIRVWNTRHEEETGGD